MFRKKFSLADLIGKEIVLTNKKGWSKHGAIWTPNNIDYDFAYRFSDKCIGLIGLQEGGVSLIKNLGNIYYLKSEQGVSLVNGGESQYSSCKTVDPRYESINNYLEEMSRNHGPNNLLNPNNLLLI